MDAKRQKRISKFLSLVLRHRPEKISITLDSQGWTSVVELLAAMQKHNFSITREELETMVSLNDKQRYSFNEDRTKIRANQGHSVPIELGYSPMEPPEFLYHGTPQQFVESIKRTGLDKRNRHHVHLSPTRETATIVGQRRGKPVILTIEAAKMHQAGHQFFISDNGVWLTEAVPVEFIQFPE